MLGRSVENFQMYFLWVDNDAKNIKLNIWIKFAVIVHIPFSKSDSQLFWPRQGQWWPIKKTFITFLNNLDNLYKTWYTIRAHYGVSLNQILQIKCMILGQTSQRQPLFERPDSTSNCTCCWPKHSLLTNYLYSCIWHSCSRNYFKRFKLWECFYSGKREYDSDKQL